MGVPFINFDWAAFDKLGALGISALALFAGYRIVVMFVGQWKVSTEAINRNTDSFEKLSEVFETQSKREKEFQVEVLHMMHDSYSLVSDTSRKVTHMYHKMVAEDKMIAEDNVVQK